MVYQQDSPALSTRRRFLSSCVFVGFLCLFFSAGFLFVSDVFAQEESDGCARFSIENSSSESFYDGYAVPWNVFSSDKELALRAGCAVDTINFLLGNNDKNQYIWNTAYISRNGSDWETVSLEGGQMAGGWFRGGAFADISTSTQGGGSDYLLAYICTNQNGEWKCGCRDANTCDGTGSWQLQEVQHQSVNQLSARLGGTTASLQDVDFNGPSIFYPSDYVVRRGARAFLWGGGFEPGQKVFFTGYGPVNANVNQSGTGISFQVPNNIPYGRYDIYVEDESGNSNESFVVVKDPNKTAPRVSNVSPGRISPGETMSLSGSGFTASGNEIRTNFGVVSGETSTDGRTLSFTFPEIDTEIGGTQLNSFRQQQGLSRQEFRELQEDGENQREEKELPGSLNLVNDNGVTGQIRFTIEF